MKNRRILNVGSGKQTYGTDFIDIYPQRKNVIKCDINREKFPFKNETFDEVYSRCVLEHCINPGNVIKEMVRVLKPHGKLIIITDNANYWTFSLDNSLHRGGYEKDYRKSDRHYMLFTDWHLKNFFEKYKIKVDSIEYIEEEYNIKNIRYMIKKNYKHISKTNTS